MMCWADFCVNKPFKKFVYKFLDDKSFHLLEVSMDNKDYTEALRAVHTLKGVCQESFFYQIV